MSKVPPLDLTFLLLETPSRPMHMTAYQVFRLPPRQKITYLPRLLAAYRSGPVARPFKQRLNGWTRASPPGKPWNPTCGTTYLIRRYPPPAPRSMTS